jgi:hypothetical protein
MRRSGTNPTAAAVGLLRLARPAVDALTGEIREAAASFLAGCRTPTAASAGPARTPGTKNMSPSCASSQPDWTRTAAMSAPA